VSTFLAVSWGSYRAHKSEIEESSNQPNDAPFDLAFLIKVDLQMPILVPGDQAGRLFREGRPVGIVDLLVDLHELDTDAVQGELLDDLRGKCYTSLGHGGSPLLSLFCF